jgi:hypothetical protein
MTLCDILWSAAYVYLYASLKSKTYVFFFISCVVFFFLCNEINVFFFLISQQPSWTQTSWSWGVFGHIRLNIQCCASLMQITLYTRTFVLPHFCRILYLLYIFLNVLGLNLDHPKWDIYLDTPQSVRHSSGRVIGPSQRPLPDKIQRSQEIQIHASGDILLYSVRNTCLICFLSWLLCILPFFVFTYDTTQTPRLPAGFEPAIPACALPQTITLHRPATGIGNKSNLTQINSAEFVSLWNKWPVDRTSHPVFNA